MTEGHNELLPMKTRKEEERRLRRELIVRCARKCFFNQGFKAATMSGIAHECRLAKGTLYLYFSGKEDLFAALVEEGQHILRQAVDTAIEEAEGDVERKLLDIAGTFYRFSQQNREYFRILMMIDYGLLSSRVDQDKLQRILDMQQEMYRKIENVHREGIRQGIFPAGTDVIMAVRSFWAMLHGGIFLVEKSRQQLPLLAGIDDRHFTDDLMHIMIRSLKAGFITHYEDYGQQD